MDPVKILLLSLVALIFAIQLGFVFVFPRVWLWVCLRASGHQLPFRELARRLWQIDSREMRKIAETQDEEFREEIARRLKTDLMAWSIYAAFGAWIVAAIFVLIWWLS